MNKLKHSLLFVAAFLCLAPLASANSVTYDVMVDTSWIPGVAGSLDFNFNPGPLVTQPASLQILNFNTDGALVSGPCVVGGPCVAGNVSGVLPSAVTFNNGTGFNDYFVGFIYGNTLSFDVSFYGPALSAPDGVSTSGSTFAFSMFYDAAGTMPVLTNDAANGFALTVNVNLDGTTTVVNSSEFNTLTVVTAPTVPIPAAFWLTGSGLVGLFGFVLRKPA